ncbi:MAG: hydrolase [Stagnimonas sp.]|nr:hydrolase [Stagnimonas sp.]
MTDYAPYLSPIDAALPAMHETLVRLASINSGSFNAAGVTAMAEAMREVFAPLQASSELLDLASHRSVNDAGIAITRPVGKALRLRLRPQAPLQVFFCGHLDTVFAADHSFQTVKQIDADTLNGPGVADLKGGLLVLLQALMALERSPWKEKIGWTVLMNPDEEIGSVSSAPLLAEAAKSHHLGLIYEPALPDGSLASARKGSGNFNVVVHGRAAHAGRDFDKGRNAIAACADFISGLNALNGTREGVTINPGYVKGGGALNVVPDLAVFKFNVRTSQASDECWMHDELDLLMTRLNAREGLHCELSGGFTRPPKVVNAEIQRLMDYVGDCGTKLGLGLHFKPTGGCCDGNNLAAHGLANLDNMGVVGDRIHSDQEWMRVSSISERAKLSGLLLLRLASGELQWT